MCACKKMTNIRHGHVLLEHLWRKKSKMKWKAKMASSATAFEVVLPHQTLPEQPFVYNHHFTTTRLLHHGKMSNKRQVEAKLEKTSQKGLVWYVAKTWLLCECDFVCSGEGYSIALSQVLILCFQAAKYINNYNNISPNRLMCIKCWGIYSLQSAGLPTIVSPRGKNARAFQPQDLQGCSLHFEARLMLSVDCWVPFHRIRHLSAKVC